MSESVIIYPSNINFDALKNSIDQLENEILKQIGNSYLQNILIGQAILNMPMALTFFTYSSTITEIESETLRRYITDLSKTTEDTEALKEEIDKVQKDFLANLNSKETIQNRKDKAEGKLNRLLNNQPQIKEVINNLNYIILTFIWSATETLYKDILIKTINNYPTMSLTRIAKILNSDGKSQIDINDMISPDFSFLNSIGDILFGQETFSNLTKVRKYYTELFKLKSEIAVLLEDEKLLLLKQIRHIIIHNKSLVDKKFIKETKIKNLCIGDIYELDREHTIELTNNSIDKNIKIIKAIDIALAKFV